jgi:glycosyltransferase involved in cell wall biosynthesis
VTTQAMRSDVIRRLPDLEEKITVLPNYVDTDLFAPGSVQRSPNELLFIGRIAPEKNLAALLESLRDIEAELTLIGEGRLRPTLQSDFAFLDGRVKWEGNVSNSKLPAYINQAAAFVLPSLYEGHPKSIIEAMSCSAPVIGADSPGIREVVRHNETGLLCAPNSAGIGGAIKQILSDPCAAAEMGRRARDYVLDHYSLNRIEEMEADLITRLVRDGGDEPASRQGD